ncbi:MAG TPA: alkaline phosphatase family protein [Polyangiaceae bacterium]|jgi:predicted AlkP superfamily phosphohydrolase/phosphomutase|nr:alkaline phosphatase family protein [Polyangiaceae bacterium]
MKFPRAFIFGIDGGDWAILRSLMSRGLLPHLSRFHDEAASAALTCTQPAHTAPGWASLVTARYPGGHAAYQFFHTQEPSYRGRVTTSADVGTSTLFDWVVKQGWRVGVVNVPMSHPPRKLPGYQLTWPLANTLHFCDPPGLLAELAGAGAPFRSDLACMYRGDLSYIDEALHNIEQRKNSIKYLLEKHPVDLLATVITETDRVCHHYWHYFDPTHPQHPAAPERKYARAIEDCYKAVDSAFGELLALMPDETTVVVASDHGSGAGLEDLSLNSVLAEYGLLAMCPAERAPKDVASWFVEDGRTIDWERTRAYSPVPGCFGVNLNLKHRQELGAVSADDAEAVLRDVEEAFRELRTRHTQRPVFRNILRAAHCYPGPFTRLAPDLLLEPEEETTILSGHLSGPLWRPSYQTGLHRFEGIWMQRSPRVRTGALTQPMRIVDVAPTLLADAGAAWPEGVTGRARSDVMRSGLVEEGGCLAEDGEGAAGATMDEDPLVSERLRAMGYL